MNSPAYKVPNHISMAYIYFNTVTHLVNICSVEILSKGCFDARAILKKLLKHQSDTFTCTIMNNDNNPLDFPQGTFARA